MYKLFFINKNKIFNIIDYVIDLILLISIILLIINKINIFKYLLIIATFIYIIKFIFENKLEIKNRTKTYLNKIILIKNKKNIFILYKKINFTFIFIIIITISYLISYFTKSNSFQELVILLLLMSYEISNIIHKIKLNYLNKNINNDEIISNYLDKNKYYKILKVNDILRKDDYYIINKRIYYIHPNYINKEELIELLNNYK